MEVTGEPVATALRLSKALGLARHGKLREAQQLLAAEGTLPENPLELHALAALATGEGDYLRAQRLWRLLLQREPGHAEAKRMIDSIDLWLSRPSWCRFIPVGLGVVALVVIIALVSWILGGDEPAPVRASPRAEASAPVYAPQSAPPAPIVLPTVAPNDGRRRKR